MKKKALSICNSRSVHFVLNMTCKLKELLPPYLMEATSYSY